MLLVTRVGSDTETLGLLRLKLKDGVDDDESRLVNLTGLRGYLVPQPKF